MTSYYSPEELAGLGLGSFGEDVRISRYARLYGAAHMHFGSHVRIDDFCLLSGRITLGSYIHIAAGVLLYGGEAGIFFDDYTTASSRCALYAQSDDYSGEHMTNPTVPEAYTGVCSAPVTIGKHVILGTGSTVLPGVSIGEGCAVGAMTLLNRSTEPWGVYYGVPARRQGERKRGLLALCRQLEESGGAHAEP